MDKSNNNKIVALINPKRQKIACVLLQAAVGGNSRIPSRFFDTEVWETNTLKGFIPMHGTIEEWKQLALRWNPKDCKKNNASYQTKIDEVNKIMREV